MKEPTNRELNIMIENSIQRSDERHVEVLGVLKEIKDDIFLTKKDFLSTQDDVKDLKWWKQVFIWLLMALWIILPFAWKLAIDEQNKNLENILARYNILVDPNQ